MIDEPSPDAAQHTVSHTYSTLSRKRPAASSF